MAPRKRKTPAASSTSGPSSASFIQKPKSAKVRNKRIKKTLTQPSMDLAEQMENTERVNQESPTRSSRLEAPSPMVISCITEVGKEKEVSEQGSEEVEHDREGTEEGEDGDKCPGSGTQMGSRLKRRCQWSEAMTDVYCEALIDNIKIGGRADGSFKPAVWTGVCAKVKEQCTNNAGNLTPKHCKAKLDNLRRKYNLWNKLRNRSGWSCDQVTGQLCTSSEVWDAEIAVNPDARQMRNKPVRNCWELEKIFSATTATGEFALQGGNLRERFSGEWKEPTPVPRKVVSKNSDSHTALLTTAIEEFRTTQSATGSEIRHAVRRIMDLYRPKEEWTQQMCDRALDLFKEEAMAEIFNELEGDAEYQEHWLRRQVS